MKFFCLLITSLIAINANAQVNDDFGDGDLHLNPQWQGMLDAFKDTSSFMRSNYQVPNSLFYLSTPVVLDSTMNWIFNGKLGFNTSSLNYIDLVLISDTMDFRFINQGLLLRLGGTNDDLALIKIENGKEIKLIDGPDNIFNKSSNTFNVIVESAADSFLLHFSDGQANNLHNKAYYKLPDDVAYSGVRIRQSTASFFNRHFFDRIYIGPQIKDTTPLHIDSVHYNSNGWLNLKLSESLNLEDTVSWKFNLNGPSECLYDSMVFVDDNEYDELCLHFPCLLDNQWYELKVFGLRDTIGNVSDTFESQFFTLKTESPERWDILITEMMVDPEPSKRLGDYEYLELYNRSDKYIELNSLEISDLTECKSLGNKILYPDSFIVCIDIPSLNNAGDRIELRDKYNLLIHTVQYDLSWYHDDLKTEGGYSLEMMDPNGVCKGANNWKASEDIRGGTPGAINSVNTQLPIDTMPPHLKKYELIHPDILNLYFDENFDTIVESNWSLYLNEILHSVKIRRQVGVNGFLSLELNMNLNLDSIYKLRFKGVEDCEGNYEDWIEIIGRMVASPLKHELVFNEVLFNPKTGGKDYIELFNRSNHLINLNRTYFLDPLSGMILKLADSFKVLYPQTYALLTTDTMGVCKDYSCGGNPNLKVQMIELPDMPDEGTTLILINQNSEMVDSFTFDESWHFSMIKDRNGVGLERINPEPLNPARSNWTSASSLSGYGTPGKENSQYLSLNPIDGIFSLSSHTISPDNDGFEDFILMRYQMNESDYLCTVRLYDSRGLLVSEPYVNFSLGISGALEFEGVNDKAEILPEGVYLMHVKRHNPDKKSMDEYFTIYVVR